MPATFDDLTVIMVTHNSARVLPETLPALSALPNVAIFDNASTDSTAAVARRLLPRARIVESPRNLGFGGGNNAILETVTTRFALLLNPDCIVDTGALQRLLEAAERHPEAAALSPRLVNRDGKFEACLKRHYYEKESPDIDPAGDCCAEVLTAACLLLRMEPMRRVGFFDPWFFIYYEDDDLCLRIRRAGYPMLLVHDAVMTHFVGSSSAPGARQMYRKFFFQTLSLIYIERKHRGGLAALRAALGVVAENLPKLLLFLLVLNRRMIVRSVARLAGVLAAPVRLARPFSGDPH